MVAGKARRARRSWRKLHLAVNAASGMIVAQTLTAKEMGDSSQVGPLLDQIQGDIKQVTADGAYDGAPTYQTVAQLGEHIRIVIPPHVTAVLSDEAGHGWKPSPH
jgi:IS5 family transposase